MVGFLNTEIYEDEFGEIPNDVEKYMLEQGFEIDEVAKVFIKNGEAYQTNVDSSIKNLDDLRNYYDPILKENPYDDIIKLADQGYELSFGEAGPGCIEDENPFLEKKCKITKGYGTGIYLKDYKKLFIEQCEKGETYCDSDILDEYKKLYEIEEQVVKPTMSNEDLDQD